MKDLFTRLLKVIWFFNLALGVCTILLAILSTLSGDIEHDIDDVGLGLSIFICLIPALMIMQYVLLGSFNPRRLLEKERRYPR